MGLHKTGFNVANNSEIADGFLGLGAVVAVLPAIHASAFQPPAPGVVKDGWMVCQGSVGQRTIASGPMTGAIIPDLSDNRFLQGATVSWSNANDANPTYKGGSNVVDAIYAGDGATKADWFASGDFVPAGSLAPATLTITRAHQHDLLAHSHTSGDLVAAAEYIGPIGEFAHRRASPYPRTDNIYGRGNGPDALAGPSAAAINDYIAVEGATATTLLPATISTPAPSAPAPANAAHPHPYTGTPTPIPSTFAGPGSYVPLGTLNASDTEKRPNFISVIYLIRVG